MKEIRDAVGICRDALNATDGIYAEITKKVVRVLIDFAEKVLAVEGKMPEKKKHSDWDCGDTHCIVCEDRGYNQAIDDCRIAITGALLSEEELSLIVRQELLASGDVHNQYWGEDQVISAGRWREILGERISKAIHSAQMEKLGGVR